MAAKVQGLRVDPSPAAEASIVALTGLALGLDANLRIHVSAAFTARTSVGRSVYDLHGRMLRPRPGTPVPAADHASCHLREVFNGEPMNT
ncbi:hypothetical protein RMN56_06080 [Micromonospora halotolerans]|uniref:Uncharacterized protein n=1 Tax=Micromonospora halotolerans TaxID=709879 RepID=A0ABZ0A039_9ACTN|nr:hypothetical protein [Micromonospora halotolerans]WNM40916.1 hypothetical protein RMN56_06080 [Micromonospora halotolerans]